MSFYDNMAATASRLITEFGKPMTFKRTTGSSIDPVTGAVTPGTTQTFTPPGIFKQITNDLIDGTLIQAGDKMMVIDNSFAPTLTDKVTINSVDWSIMDITPIEPAGLALVYFVRVRK